MYNNYLFVSFDLFLLFEFLSTYHSDLSIRFASKTQQTKKTKINIFGQLILIDLTLN